MGSIVTSTAQALTVENLLSGKHQTFKPLADKNLTVRWSPDGQYALLFGDHAYLLSLKDSRLQLLQTPDPAAQTRPYNQPPLWSPDSQQALYALGDTVYHLTLLPTVALTPLSVSTTLWSWRAAVRLIFTRLIIQATKQSPCA